MSRKITIFLTGLFLVSTPAFGAKSNNNTVKQQLSIEISELINDLASATSQLHSLTQDNQQIKIALNEMETWGLLQQEEKDKYYIQAADAIAEAASVKGALAAEKAGQAKLVESYRKLKSIMGCLFGSLLAFVCYRFLDVFASAASLLGGPQFKLISYLAPAAGFGAGYFMVYLYF